MKPIPKRYALVANEWLESFEEDVNEMIARGWKCYGSPFIDSEDRYHQALVREEEPNESD